MRVSFFFNDTATTEIYTLSLHDALPIFFRQKGAFTGSEAEWQTLIHHYGGNPLALKLVAAAIQDLDRKSTRLNSSHANISYAVFCLKKKKYWECTGAASRAADRPPSDRC